MQDGTQAARIAQHQVKVVIGLRVRSLRLQISPEGSREAEQGKCLIDEVRSQVVKRARTRHLLFSPAILYNRAVAVIVYFVGAYLTCGCEKRSRRPAAAEQGRLIHRSGPWK